MHHVSETEYGLRLTLEGFIEQDEMDTYCATVRDHADKQVGSFSVMADMRKTTAMPEGSEQMLQELMQYCDKQGLKRAAGIFESTTTAYQTEKKAEKVNHADGNALFIDATTVDDWEQAALDWIQNGTRPSE